MKHDLISYVRPYVYVICYHKQGYNMYYHLNEDVLHWQSQQLFKTICTEAW